VSSPLVLSGPFHTLILSVDSSQEPVSKPLPKLPAEDSVSSAKTEVERAEARARENLSKILSIQQRFQGLVLRWFSTCCVEGSVSCRCVR